LNSSKLQIKFSPGIIASEAPVRQGKIPAVIPEIEFKETPTKMRS
jgi:hypothetical protein